MGIFVFGDENSSTFFEVTYLLTQKIQIVSGTMRADVWDLSKTNQDIFEVTESPKSNIYAHEFEELARKKVNFKFFT